MYANEEFEVKELYFDCQKRKSFVLLAGKKDPDIEIRMPTLNITATSNSDDTFDFYSLTHPVDQVFAVFSAIKRVIGFSTRKHSMTTTLLPSTPLTRTICGFETCNSKETVKFSASIEQGRKWSNSTWDSVLGTKWDMIPCHGKQGEDILIKILRFTEHRNFGMHTIRCQFITCQGHYKSSDYRSLYVSSSE